MTGEGGGPEIDGAGTVLAAASSWVKDNHNPGMDRDAVGTQLAGLLGAERLLWVDVPTFDDPEDPWPVP